MSKTPEQIAEQILDAHAIQSGFSRTGDVIAGLIVEAIEADRAERRIILRSGDGLTPWRVRVDTPYEAYEQVGELLADGVFPDQIVWEK